MVSMMRIRGDVIWETEHSVIRIAGNAPQDGPIGQKGERIAVPVQIYAENSMCFLNLNGVLSRFRKF